MKIPISVLLALLALVCSFCVFAGYELAKRYERISFIAVYFWSAGLLAVFIGGFAVFQTWMSGLGG